MLLKPISGACAEQNILQPAASRNHQQAKNNVQDAITEQIIWNSDD